MRATLLFLFLIFFSLPAGAAMVEGRVVTDDGPLPGMRVAAYGSLDRSAEPLAVSAPTDAEGHFRMRLPEGTYAFFATGAEGRWFAFCGRNPVQVEGDSTWVGLQAVPSPAAAMAPYDDEYSTAIEGQVLFGSKPLAGAYVYLYLDVADDLKGQGYRCSPPTGPDGFFAFDGLPESRYFLVARKRASGERVGPVLEGDYLGVYGGNPVVAQAGRTTRVRLATVRKVHEAAASETFARSSGPVLRGVVKATDGRPLAGLHVFAYTDRVIGHQRPAALSTPTGADGRFAVELPAAGVYYVGARQRYGDSPAPGELFGMYEETADHGLEVAAGQNPEEITIVVEEIDLN